MAKYGVDNFCIEQIDSASDFSVLGKLERKYISEYKSTNREFGYNITAGGESNQLDANPRARITLEDVKQIRRIYNEGKLGCKEAWNEYSDRISFSAFEKVYEGATWKSIMPEVYTKENKILHKQMRANNGEKNGNSFLTDEYVYEIRKYYVNHTLKECYAKYGEFFSSIDTFRKIIDTSYNNIPKYSKTSKEWYYQKNKTKRVCTKNNIRITDDIIEIDTFSDFGELNGTFITDKEYADVIKGNKWSNMNGKLYTYNSKNKIVFLHNIIIGDNKKTFYINGNTFDVRKNNLTHNLSWCKIMDFGFDKFQTMCLNEQISLRQLSKAIGVSPKSVSSFIEKNHIKISKNKVRKTINND